MTPASEVRARRDRRRRRREREREGARGEEGDLEADQDETETGTEDDSQYSDEDRQGDTDADAEGDPNASAYIGDDYDDQDPTASDSASRLSLRSRPQSRRASGTTSRNETGRRAPFFAPAMVFQHDASPSPSRGRSPSPSPHRRKAGAEAPVAMNALARPPPPRHYGSMTGPAQNRLTSMVFDNPVPFAPRTPGAGSARAPEADCGIAHGDDDDDDDTFDAKNASYISALATPASAAHGEPLRKRSMVSVSLGPTPRSGRRANRVVGSAAEGDPAESGWSAVQGVGRRRSRRSSVVSRRSLAAGVELGRSTNGQTVGGPMTVTPRTPLTTRHAALQRDRRPGWHRSAQRAACIRLCGLDRRDSAPHLFRRLHELYVSWLGLSTAGRS